ncbi:MAG TPA: hypothetical protein VI915_06630 [Thermoplasmata archaeon]|nr:hypothetical protein [Thermoplasmata archaeon]
MRPALLRLGALALAVAAILLGVLAVRAPAAPVSVTVPFKPTPVADADLDGDPATGAWSDALVVQLPLENGAASPYGSVTMYAKQDGTHLYLRMDGKVDVPWASAAGNHFWFGVLLSPASVTGHHQDGQDGVFFGDSSFTSGPPLFPVDTNGAKPPLVDASQDDLGEMRATGASAPYDFTAEWKRKLDTGDPGDVAFAADGTTGYYVYATTDSGGGGSGGGALSHNAVTNDNVVRFEVPRPEELPSYSVKIVHEAPQGVTPGMQAYLTAVLTNATAAEITWHNGTMTTDLRAPMTNLSEPVDQSGQTGWRFAAYLPAQPAPTQVRYAINASGPQGFRAESYFYTVAEPAAAGITPEQQETWILSLAASMSMAVSVVAVLYMYTGRRLRREGR